MGSLQDSKPPYRHAHSQYTHRGRAWGTSRRNAPGPKTHLRRNPTCAFSYDDAPTPPVSGWSGTFTPQHTCPAPQQPLLPGWPQVLTSGDTGFRCFQGSVEWNRACALLLRSITSVRAACRRRVYRSLTVTAGPTPLWVYCFTTLRHWGDFQVQLLDTRVLNQLLVPPT